MKIITNYFFGIVRILLGLIFILASFDKIAFPDQFMSSILAYNVLPISLVPIIGYSLPWIELFVGVFLVVGLFTKETALVASVLLFVFIVVLATAVARGIDMDCGCFGSMPLLEGINFPGAILRDVILFVLACLLWRKQNIFSLIGIRAINEKGFTKNSTSRS